MKKRSLAELFDKYLLAMMQGEGRHLHGRVFVPPLSHYGKTITSACVEEKERNEFKGVYGRRAWLVLAEAHREHGTEHLSIGHLVGWLVCSRFCSFVSIRWVFWLIWTLIVPLKTCQILRFTHSFRSASSKPLDCQSHYTIQPATSSSTTNHFTSPLFTPPHSSEAPEANERSSLTVLARSISQQVIAKFCMAALQTRL